MGQLILHNKLPILSQKGCIPWFQSHVQKTFKSCTFLILQIATQNHLSVSGIKSAYRAHFSGSHINSITVHLRLGSSRLEQGLVKCRNILVNTFKTASKY